MLRKISQKQREEGSVETGSCHRKGVHEGRIRTHVEGVQPPQCPVAAGELCGPQNSLPAVRTPLSPDPHPLDSASFFSDTDPLVRAVLRQGRPEGCSLLPG